MQHNIISNHSKFLEGFIKGFQRVVISLGGLALGFATGLTAVARSPGVQVVYTDSQAAILRTDVGSGAAAVLSAGQKLVQPLGIAAGANGEFFITDTGCGGIIGVNPRTGEQRLVASGGALGVPFGIAVERGGSLVVANGSTLVRVDPVTGASAVVSSNQFFQAPIAAAVAPDGDIYVVDALGAVIRVDAVTGHQNLLARGIFLHRPQGIAVRGAHIYVTDVATADGNFGVGRIVHIDRQSGAQRIVSQGQNLVGPVGITIAEAGQLIVGDPYTINEQSADLFDGAILVVDATTGAQNVVLRGSADFVNPRCVAIVPTQGSTH
jgi:streptogramin lyase